MSKIKEATIEAKRKGYYVDKQGNVYSLNKKLSLKLNRDRYFFSIRLNGERISFPLHKFVAYIKFGDVVFEEGIQVRHLNGNSLDNSWDNIEIGIQSDNMLDIPIKKRKEIAINASNYVRRFSDDVVLNIKKDRKNGFTYKDLCEKYNTNKGTLSYLFNKSLYANNEQ